MRYVSLFSGVEAASVAWEPLGWEPVAFCEVEPFPSAVLAHRFPDVPNLGDIRDVDWSDFSDGAVDLVVGGSPCQSFSVAGGRASLDGESRLMFEYIRAVREIRPRWILWENVPGVLSVRDNAFGQLLGELSDIGYGLAWRVLDAQFFGVAQRRRRVFLVGCLGGVGRAAAVLFERDSVRGNTASSREKRQAVASHAEGRAGGGSPVITNYGDDIAWTLTARHDSSPCSDRGQNVAAFAQNSRDEMRLIGGDGSAVGALDATSGTKQTSYVCMASAHTNAEIGEDMSPALIAHIAKDAPIVVDRAAFNQGGGAAFAPHIEQTELMDTIVARGPHAVSYRTEKMLSGPCAPETPRESGASTLTRER